MKISQLLGLVTHHVKKMPNPENRLVTKRAAEEGIVLLKNDGVLPLKEKKVALFGSGACDTVICGTGSGYVFADKSSNIYDSFKKAGYEVTSSSWLKRFEKTSKTTNKKDKSVDMIGRTWSGLKIFIDEPSINQDEMDEAIKADTAIFVVRRSAGEGSDRKAVKGDYYLSDAEKANLEKIASAFKHTVVVLNTCVIDGTYLASLKGVEAIVYLGLAGMETGSALADVLAGACSPSGKLTDTWAKKYEDNPASKTFSSNDGITLQEDYTEGIYVGYRYFDSFGIEPLYPFGYGLSYSSFEKKLVSYAADWDKIVLKVNVTNSGKAAAKDVTEVYISAPQGKLDKPYQELKGFEKTKLLQPLESEELTIEIPTISLASFDEESSAFIMEKGNYLVRFGDDSRHTQVGFVLKLDEDKIIRKVTDVLHPDKKIEDLKPPKHPIEKTNAPALELKAADFKTIDSVSKEKKETVTYVPEGVDYKSYVESNPYKLPQYVPERIVKVANKPNCTLLDVEEGKATLEEFVASLDAETLCTIVTGIGTEKKHPVPNRMTRKAKKVSGWSSSGETTAQYVQTLGIPNSYLTDGPTGLHIMGCGATSFPVGMVMAQTWNKDIIRECGDGYGKDMDSFDVNVCLGPGMNIHRDPLCGRNFEYYSEDPLITGVAAKEFTLGVQSHKGRGVSIKHFLTNNQENDRLTLNNTVSIRALREIYLAGFETVVKEANPMTIMTCYNKLNGYHTSSNRELLTDIVRGEWGFKNYIMTDWGTTSTKPEDYHAGNDLVMGGLNISYILQALRDLPPEFNPNGGIKKEVISTYGGFMKETRECWNSFLPLKDGKDQVTTVISQDVKPDPQVLKDVQDGKCIINKEIDGKLTVKYFGTHLGACLPLGDIQACAIRLLKGLMNSAAMTEMLNNLK